MIVLLDTSTDLDEAARELSLPVGQLLTPLTRFRNRRPDLFAIDNGAFSGFRARAFRSLLKREEANRAGCLFVAAPDVVPFRASCRSGWRAVRAIPTVSVSLSKCTVRSTR